MRNATFYGKGSAAERVNADFLTFPGAEYPKKLVGNKATASVFTSEPSDLP